MLPRHPPSPSHSEGQSSTSPNGSRPTKRRRPRTERACRSCVKSKTRCEDFVMGQGCFRCRKRHDHCSFLESPPSPIGRSVGQLPEIQHKLNSVNELSDRVARLEHALMLARHSPATGLANDAPQSLSGPLTGPSMHPSTPGVSNHSITLHGSNARTTRTSQGALWAEDAPSFDERVFCTVGETGYMDPVQGGLVTREQVDLAFQMFKHRLALMLPLHPTTLPTTATPEHPLLILAVLLHVPAIAPASRVYPLLDQCVLHALSGAVSVQVVLAFLVLSIAPLPKLLETDSADASSDHTVFSHITSLRAVSLAYETGASLGLEERTRAAIRRRDEWNDPWNASKVSEILLWETVKSRHVLLTLMTSRASPCLLPLPLAHRLPTSGVSDSVRQTIERLVAEAELVDLVRDSFERVAILEVEGIDSVPNGLEEAEHNWGETFAKLETFRKAQTQQIRFGSIGNMITYDANALQFAFVFRLGTFYQRLPSVISADLRMAGIRIAGGLYVLSSSSMLDLALSHEGSPSAAQLPSHLVTMFTIVLIGAHRSNWFVQEHYPDIERYPFDSDRLQRAHTWLESINPPLAKMVDSVCTNRMGPGWRRDGNVGKLSEAHAGLPGFTGDLSGVWDGVFGLPEDWVNMDFAAWAASAGV